MKIDLFIVELILFLYLIELFENSEYNMIMSEIVNLQNFKFSKLQNFENFSIFRNCTISEIF